MVNVINLTMNDGSGGKFAVLKSKKKNFVWPQMAQSANSLNSPDRPLSQFLRRSANLNRMTD
jgi:hypothetical protein